MVKPPPSVDVPSGVPQGSVLGPIPFLLYVNGITEGVRKECDISVYADDNLLSFEIKSRQNHSCIQENMTQVQNWFHDWFMEFNVSISVNSG